MRSLFIALLIALPAIVLAQSNYHEGYVLKNNGDTLKGYINYREWAYSPLSVEFKPNKNSDEVLQFNPQTIKGFQVTGFETYISYIGLISTNRNIFPDIPSNLDTIRVQRAIFLKQLVTGNHITLYLNNEVHENRFFFAETNEIPVELKYYEYYVNSKSDEVFDNIFRGQLLLLINKYNSGDSKLTDKLKQVKFGQQDLENIVDEINNAGLGTKEYISNRKNNKSRLRLFGGIGINSIANTYDYSELQISTVNNEGAISQITKSHSSNTLAPKISFGIDLLNNPNVQQFIFRTELSYSFFSGQFTTPATGTNNTAYALAYNQHAITLTPQFLLNVYNTDKLKVYVDAGIAIGISYYSDNTSGINVNETAVEYGASASGWYIPIQAGIVFNKKIEVSVAYASCTTSAGYAGVEVSNKSSMNFGIKVLLN